MTNITIQSLAIGEADQIPFVEEDYLSAAGKRQILADWQRFSTGGFKKLFFTRDLYRFLHHNCGFTAHTSQETFWGYTCNSEVGRLRAFLNQFGGNGLSAEYGTQAWLDGPAADLKQAMCQVMVHLYAPLLQVLEDLELKHAELGRAWREFAIASRVPDPSYPPHYLVSENTRNLLAYAAYIALHKPQPLPGLQRQFSLFSPPLETGLYVARAA